MKFGCHVSIEGGVSNAVRDAARRGVSAFAMWTRNARGWTAKPLDPAEVARFRAACTEHGFDSRTDIVPHASYLINLASPSEETRAKSFAALLDELGRCEALGIGLYNMHPGSTLGEAKRGGIERLADAINRAHAQTSGVRILLENMAGNPDRVVGTAFEDLRDVIALVEDKSRVGVCVDTCHAFAAGHDLRTQAAFDAFWAHFDKVIGREYLGAMHINDSCWPRDSHRDQHAGIGMGFLGLEAFRVLMNNQELADVPKILETGDYDTDIATLEFIIGKPEPDTLELGRDLAGQGAGMRAENQAKTDRKRGTKAAAGTKRNMDLKSMFAKRPKKAESKKAAAEKAAVETAEAEEKAKPAEEAADTAPVAPAEATADSDVKTEASSAGEVSEKTPVEDKKPVKTEADEPVAKTVNPRTRARRPR